MSVNQRIGTAIRARRVALGISQESLGKAIGITFQQIQKYENGTNSLNIMRLFDVSQALSTQPARFLDVAASQDAIKDKFSDRASLEMMKRFHDLTASEQEAIIAFMKALSANRNPKKKDKPWQV